MEETIEMRPGRKLFLRLLTIGSSKDQLHNLQLCFLHGTCGSQAQYQPMLDALAKQMGKTGAGHQFSVVLLDQVGCGKLSPLPDRAAYSNEETMADVKSVINKYVMKDTPTVVIAHSYATSVLLPLLRTEPTLNLAGCVFIGSAVRSSHLPLPDGGLPIMGLPVPLLRCFQRRMTETFLKMAVHPTNSKLKEAIRSDCNRNDMSVVKAYHQNMKWVAEDYLGGIADIPALIIHGAEDGVIPIECAQHIHRSLPKSELVRIEDASHLVMMEKPDETAQHLYSFLTKLF